MYVDREKIVLHLCLCCIDAKDLAEKSGVPAPTVYRIMGNPGKSKVRTSTAGKIARALGVDVTEILAD